METLKVKIKKLNEEAVIPFYAKPGDAGLDITAIGYEYDKETDCHVYHTGLSFEVPEGYVMLIYPRSSNRRTKCYLSNHVGILDSGYRGELLLSFKDRDEGSHIPPYKVSERIAQIMIVPYPKVEFEEVDVLSISERGEAGHGSTGK